jgi:hypothetical protein
MRSVPSLALVVALLFAPLADAGTEVYTLVDPTNLSGCGVTGTSCAGPTQVCGGVATLHWTDALPPGSRVTSARIVFETAAGDQGSYPCALNGVSAGSFETVLRIGSCTAQSWCAVDLPAGAYSVGGANAFAFTGVGGPTTQPVVLMRGRPVLGFVTVEHESPGEQHATQASVDALAGSLDVAVSTRATQASVDALASSLDAPVSSRATQASVDALASNLNAPVSSRATQASVDALASNLNAPVSSRATQASVDALASNLNAPVSSRATQASVDALSSNVDAPVSSRATQASVDALASRLATVEAALADHAAGVDDLRTLVLRSEIERALLRNEGLALPFLPAANGGYADVVRDVVAGVIAEAELAGVRTGHAAAELADGDEALAGAEWKDAWDAFRRAYREVVTGGN